MEGLMFPCFYSDFGLRFSFALTFPKNSCLIVRIQTYLQSTRPIIEQYEKQGKVRTIDASRSVDEVWLIFFSFLWAWIFRGTFALKVNQIQVIWSFFIKVPPIMIFQCVI